MNTHGESFPIHIINDALKVAHTTYINDFDIIKSEKLVTPFVFAFRGGEVVLSLDKNGWWNPQGGHLESGENIYDALIREAYEEAGILINKISFVGAIKFDVKEVKDPAYTEKYPLLSYLPIAHASVIHIDQAWAPRETSKRSICTFEDAIERLNLRNDNGLMLSIFKNVYDLKFNSNGNS